MRIKIVFITALILLLTQNLMSTLTYSPLQPNVEQQVLFTVTHPDGISPQSPVLWNFGDGTPPSYDMSSVVKVYSRKGTYNVTAGYQTLGGQSVTDRVTVSVVEKRKISYSPLYPTVNQTVNFRAEYFFSASVDWNFGDGTIVTGTTTIAHAYVNPGIYTVVASDGPAGQGFTTSTTVRVTTEPKGPRAAFQLFFIQLRFDDGKPYKVVPKDYQPLKAYADLKYEGTGVLRAQWMLDGASFGIVSRLLPFAQQTTIDSGEILSLPTIVPGVHEVSLKVLEPLTDYQVPVIRYFVSEKKPEAERMDVSVSKAMSLDRKEIRIDKNTIEAPSKEYFLLKGKIKSEIDRELPYALLRVYLENELVYQQLVEDVKPQKEIEFETSIYNPSPEPKKIYLALYDIINKPPRLLFLKRWHLQSK